MNAKKQTGGFGGSRDSELGRRDADRVIWRAKQQQRRDRRDQKSGVFGYGLLAESRRGDETDGTDRG